MSALYTIVRPGVRVAWLILRVLDDLDRWSIHWSGGAVKDVGVDRFLFAYLLRLHHLFDDDRWWSQRGRQPHLIQTARPYPMLHRGCPEDDLGHFSYHLVAEFCEIVPAARWHYRLSLVFLLPNCAVFFSSEITYLKLYKTMLIKMQIHNFLWQWLIYAERLKFKNVSSL